jgi:acyl carrier protein
MFMNVNTFDIVRSAVMELNEELCYDSLRSITPETPLFGGEEGIDSLSLVRLVAEIERKVEEDLDCNIVLADDRTLSMSESPFRTVGALTGLVDERLEEVNP